MSLLGKPFRDYVQTQIDRREEALGKGPTTGSNNDVSKTFFQNVPWIRLSSGVDLTNEETVEKIRVNVKKFFRAEGRLIERRTETIPISGSVLDKLVKRGYNENEIKGAELAKNFVLFGGVISQENSSIQRYSGLSGNRWGGAYGFGLPSDISDERGYIPMPGIESVDFSYKNDGALAQATVKIKCYSRSQFEIIDILYMRPGYTVLLEFGHSVFIDNENNVARAGEGDYSFYTEPFSKMSSKVSFSDLKSKILEEKEKWNGNYEGFYAKITKFNWSFSNNVYNITINLVGFGDVISSLNAAPSPSIIEIQDSLKIEDQQEEEEIQGKIEESQNPIVSQVLKSSLNAKLFLLFKRLGGKFNEKKILLGDADMVRRDSEGKIQGKIPTVSDVRIAPLYPQGIKYKSYDETTGKIEVKTFTGDFPLSLFQVFNVKDDGNTSGRDAYYPNTYISFGLFCAILQNEVNLFTKDGEFLINIDINYADLSKDKNIMRVFPGMFSADPSKVLIPYLPHEGRTSTDVFGEGGMLDEIMNNSLIEGATKHLRPNFYLDIDKGRLAYVLLDMAYLANVVSSNVNKNEKTLTISPLKILEDILSTINKTTGGINEFKVIEDTDTGFIKILSEVPQDNNDDDDLKSINSYGFTKNNFLSSDIRGSFVKSLNLSSELSENWASQISIGAQNNSSQQGGNGASFSEYSKGLIDRIIPEKLSIDPEIKKQDPPKTLDDIITDEILEQIKLLYIGGNFLGYTNYIQYEWSSETIESVLTFNKNHASLLTGINAKKQYAPTPFYIPFNLSLDLLGLGGLRIYDGFKFDGKVLPISYQPESIKLIIKSLSHNVSVDGWTTKVETLAQPIAKLVKPENTVQSVPPSSNSAAAGSNSNNSGGGRNQVGAGGNTIPSGYPVGNIYYDGPTNKTQIYLHHTAGGQNIRAVIDGEGGWNTRTDKVSTHFITNNTGQAERLYPDEAWGNHLGLSGSSFSEFGLNYQNLNKISLGIELCSFGGLTLQGSKYKSWSGQTIPSSEVARPVNEDGEFITYRKYQYFQKYSDAQIATAKKIVVEWKNKYNIPFKYDYDTLFTYNKTPFTGAKGIYTHNSVRRDKSDAFPQAELITMLKSISD